MTDLPDTSAAAASTTRRQFVRRSGAILGGVGTVSAMGTATADQEEKVTTRGVIPEQPTFEQSLVGFFVQLSRNVDPIEASVDDECDFVSWPNDETMAIDAMLIDRTADPEQHPITLYLHERVEVASGLLFIVNNVEQCRSGYKGLWLERIGTDIVDLADVPTTPGETPLAEETAQDQMGPGFDLVAAAVALLGGGWLLGRTNRSRDGD